MSHNQGCITASILSIIWFRIEDLCSPPEHMQAYIHNILAVILQNKLNGSQVGYGTNGITVSSNAVRLVWTFDMILLNVSRVLFILNMKHLPPLVCSHNLLHKLVEEVNMTLGRIQMQLLFSH